MLQIHDAIWWLAADDELMVAPLDTATGTVAWAQAHPADPMDHPEPDVVLGIHDSLIAGAHPPAAVDAGSSSQPDPVTSRPPGPGPGGRRPGPLRPTRPGRAGRRPGRWQRQVDTQVERIVRCAPS